MTMKSSTLAERALLVGLNIKRWGVSKKDAEATQAVETQFKTSAQAGSYLKNLILPTHLKGIRKVASDARNFHYGNTLPWSDIGWRLLPVHNFFDYNKEMSRYATEFDREVNTFVRNYPSYVNAAKKSLGTLFNKDEYPDERDIRHFFKFSVERSGIQTAGDFRVDLADGDRRLIAKEIEQRTRENIEQAQKALWERVANAVRHLAESVKEYKVTDDGVKNPFRDSAVTNLVELCDLVPKLNVTKDNALAHIMGEIKSKLTSATPEDLRNDPSLRKVTNAKAKAILSEIDGFFGVSGVSAGK